jgi:hypothetical protein
VEEEGDERAERSLDMAMAIQLSPTAEEGRVIPQIDGVKQHELMRIPVYTSQFRLGIVFSLSTCVSLLPCRRQATRRRVAGSQALGRQGNRQFNREGGAEVVASSSGERTADQKAWCCVQSFSRRPWRTGLLVSEFRGPMGKSRDGERYTQIICPCLR